MNKSFGRFLDNLKRKIQVSGRGAKGGHDESFKELIQFYPSLKRQVDKLLKDFDGLYKVIDKLSKQIKDIAIDSKCLFDNDSSLTNYSQQIENQNVTIQSRFTAFQTNIQSLKKKLDDYHVYLHKTIRKGICDRQQLHVDYVSKKNELDCALKKDKGDVEALKIRCDHAKSSFDYKDREIKELLEALKKTPFQFIQDEYEMFLLAQSTAFSMSISSLSRHKPNISSDSLEKSNSNQDYNIKTGTTSKNEHQSHRGSPSLRSHFRGKRTRGSFRGKRTRGSFRGKRTRGSFRGKRTRGSFRGKYNISKSSLPSRILSRSTSNNNNNRLPKIPIRNIKKTTSNNNNNNRLPLSHQNYNKMII